MPTRRQAISKPMMARLLTHICVICVVQPIKVQLNCIHNLVYTEINQGTQMSVPVTFQYDRWLAYNVRSIRYTLRKLYIKHRMAIGIKASFPEITYHHVVWITIKIKRPNNNWYFLTWVNCGIMWALAGTWLLIVTKKTLGNKCCLSP